MSAARWQKCPRCDGQGHTARPPWAPGDVPTWVASDTASHPCPPCSGTGLVRMPSPVREQLAEHFDRLGLGEGSA